MKRLFEKSTLPALCLTAVAVPALAGAADTPNSTMNFLASPAIAASGYASYPHVVQVRNSDVTNVIVHQPAACGERLTDAAYELEGKWLLLRYSAPYKSAWNSECVSTGMFVFHGLPADVQVVALPEPAAVAPVATAPEKNGLGMGFLATPAIALPRQYASYPHVVQVRNNDVTNVIVHQPVACGERLRDATFELEGGWLLLRYSAPYAGSWDSNCVSTGMYTFHGLPAADIQLVALPEPVPVVALAAPAEEHSLHMGFLATPAIAVPGYPIYPDVIQVHNGDMENVIVHEPCACGERITDARFELEGNWLLVRYSVPYKGSWNSECVSTGMFVFRGVTSEEIQVVTLPEPSPVPTMVARK